MDFNIKRNVNAICIQLHNCNNKVVALLVVLIVHLTVNFSIDLKMEV